MTLPDSSPDEGRLSESDLNSHTVQAVVAAVQSPPPLEESASEDRIIEEGRTELDSHANMVVLGRQAYVFEKTGRTCNVRPFAQELGMAEGVPIVDGAIAYDCPYSNQTFILIIRNALHIPSMSHNLIPPFIMRAGGVIVNDVPKIHCADPTVNDHCIRFTGSDLRIPLQLTGTF